MEGAITRHGIARLYLEQRHLCPLAMQTRNQSKRRGSSIGDTSRSQSLVQKRTRETNRGTSPPVGRTPPHTPLLMVKLHLAGEEVEAVADTGPSASVMGKHLAPKFGIWKRASKVKVRQKDGSSLKGNLVVNTIFKVMDSSSVLGKFVMDAEVWYIRNRDIISGLSWWTENAFLVDTQDRCLRNVNSSQVIPCSVRWIPEVLRMEEEPLEDGEIIVVIDASE